MTVTGTKNIREICTSALRKIGVVSTDQAATAVEIETAKDALGRMLKHWQNYGFNVWTVAAQTVALGTSAGYTMLPVRPIQVLSVRYNDGSTESPMTRLTRDEYDNLPDKTATGRPSTWYYDRQRENAVLYVWPLMAGVSGETLEITYQREIDDADLTDVVDVPGEMYDAVIYGLASNLTDDFMVNAPQVVARAEILKREALAFDREGSVFFAGPNAG